jgi:Protein of unknown function (DUF935)
MVAVRNVLRGAAAALLGISSYEANSSPAWTPSDADIERARKQNGGQLAGQGYTRTRWYLSDLETAEILADSGDLRSCAELMNAARKDGVMSGVLSTRTGGLVRLPKRFRGDPEVIEALQVGHDSIRSVFDEMFPPADLAAFAADGELLGVAVGELVEVEGRDYPVFIRLDPQFLRYRWTENRWYYDAHGLGLIPVTPGDGRWILHTPGGRSAPWRNGLWRAVGRAYIRKEHAQLHCDNWEAKLANPARVAFAPNGSTDREKDQLFQRLMAWGVNTVFSLTPGYEIKLLESNGRGYESFKQTIADCNDEFKICITGQTVTVDGGAGFQNSDIHKSIRSDLIKATADGLAYTINTQGLPSFIVRRWGPDALTARSAVVEWDVTPPKDRNNEASAMVQVATALSTLSESLRATGRELDVDALCTQFGVPVQDDTNGDGAPEADSQNNGERAPLRLVRDGEEPSEPDAPSAGEGDEGAAPAAAAAALNGAQVTALLDILRMVAMRELPRESGIKAIVMAFPVSASEAEAVMGSIGASFFIDPALATVKPAAPSPAPAEEAA